MLGVLAVPFATALATILVGHRSDGVSKAIAVGGSAAGLILAWLVAIPHPGDAEPLAQVFASTHSLRPPIELGWYVDPLSAVMLLLATTVAFLVQVYSLGYLADDPRYPSYATLVSLFTGAMVTVVTADDLWVLLVGWEVMGACSYFLISHHWELADARAGAVKAFVMTRLGDVGLLFGIFAAGRATGTYRISGVVEAAAAGSVGERDATIATLLILCGVVGKSAQFPLHSWLPDAMPGPTPISALIHAATMVAAGVYLVARLLPVFSLSDVAMTVLALIACVTMLGSA